MKIAGQPEPIRRTRGTVHADPNYDCGLLEPDGRMRPAFGAWVGS